MRVFLSSLLIGASLAAISAPALAQSSIPTPMILSPDSDGIQGRLERGDRQADGGKIYDCYAMDLRAGQTVSIIMASFEFDAYLSLHEGGTCDGVAIDSDDDSYEDDGMHAEIVNRIRRTGRFSIRATHFAYKTGQYDVAMMVE